MSFPWLVSSLGGSSQGAERRLAVALAELRDRAARLARLGGSAADTTRHLAAAVAWDYDPASRHGGPHRRPDGLSDAAIAALVDDVYRRHRP
ncbi:MAG: hypothetical protein KBG48_29855 [Kofleriaceae bacterium]|nr:hypothetical protein [Kofleriaceae bacterium]MBP9171633.1 hypothetical protein [Kofleriaceae bacterium]MBP9858972.1 hypothetical protein [Kofleriaceae bacterium]